MSNAMSLKAKIRNIAKKKNIPAQVILQNYMFERLLVRLSVSDYREKFVLKGGMLVAAIVGLDNRATMDLDTTLKDLPLTPDAIHSALEQICAIRFDDGVSFEIGTISPIREDDIYGGYRVMLNAWFDTIVTPLSIDVSTGDAITPHAVQYNFSEIFDDEKPTSCGHITSKLSWRKKWRPSCGAACSTPVPEIFMMPIYWLQRRILIKQYLKMHYRQQPITVIRLDRSRMFPAFFGISKKAQSSRQCGKGTANNSPMQRVLNTSRL